jgi:septal ring factor EnvC (AmiA/AmiB activator)
MRTIEAMLTIGNGRHASNLSLDGLGDAKPEVDRMNDTLYGGQPRLDELQAALREMGDVLAQMRSQRDVARNQCDELQRRWKQQVAQIEQRLNDSQLECERLRRELDALTRSAKHPAWERPVDTAVSEAVRPGRRTEGEAHLPTGPPQAPSLRHVFARIRDRQPCR